MADDKIQTIALSKIAAELAEKHEMSKKAAEMLNCRFRLVINGLEMLGKTSPAERPIKVAGA